MQPLTHSRNIATEEELDRVHNTDSLRVDNAISQLQKLTRRLENHFQLSETLRYLDVGCGTGGIAIALAKLGAKNVTGVDISARHIARAMLSAKRLQVDHCVKFICVDF